MKLTRTSETFLCQPCQFPSSAFLLVSPTITRSESTLTTDPFHSFGIFSNTRLSRTPVPQQTFNTFVPDHRIQMISRAWRRWYRRRIGENAGTAQRRWLWTIDAMTSMDLGRSWECSGPRIKGRAGWWTSCVFWVIVIASFATYTDGRGGGNRALLAGLMTARINALVHVWRCSVLIETENPRQATVDTSTELKPSVLITSW